MENLASPEQVEVPRHKQTHTRALPLPFTIDGVIMEKSVRQVQYAGHGQSTIVYRLSDKLVLKLCEENDQEPERFRALQASGVYQQVRHDAGAKKQTVLDGLLKHGTRG